VVEINSSFHRSHRASTWQRWRDSVPEAFRFSVKLPKAITHTHGLKGADELVGGFLEEISILGSRLGCLLVQLAPGFAFDARVVDAFCKNLREVTDIAIACEPRNASWFAAEPDELLRSYQVARVAADPARVPAAAFPAGWRGMSYYRLHGSPKIYYSSYSTEFLAALAERVKREPPEQDVWVIFDNTTLGAATRNALDLAELLKA
jgi:uncharacterized protein YecE (DUF72 family)